MAKNRPEPGKLETRHTEITADGRKIRGVVPYGIESRDMGGWREVVDRGALDQTNLDELIARIDHAGVPIGRFPRTLDLESRGDGLHWAVTPPESRADLLEAIERGDLRAGSWQMVVGRDRWEGDTRHIEQIAELRDVSVVSSPAYPAATVEYRAAPTTTNKEDKSMSEESTSPVPAEEARTEDTKQEERQAPEVKVTSEPTPVLQVEDRSGPEFYSLTAEFRSRGFPRETASLTGGEFRSASFGGTIDVLNQEHIGGVNLGYDQRYMWQIPQQVSVTRGATSVEVFQQTGRTVNAGTVSIRAIDATSNKPEVSSVLNVTTIPLKQVAGVQTGVPNVYLEKDQLATVVEADLRLNLFDGLDELVRAGLATSGFQAPSTDNIFVSIRKAITTLRAAGYNPDVVALTPAASETIDTMVSGITGGSADFTFGAGNFGPNNIFGLRRVESKTLAAPVVWDSANHGRFYMSDVSLARFEESAGRTNTSLVRLETHAAYGTERAAAAVRIAAS
jgi:HK97 family phage prohead protease